MLVLLPIGTRQRTLPTPAYICPRACPTTWLVKGRYTRCVCGDGSAVWDVSVWRVVRRREALNAACRLPRDGLSHDSRLQDSQWLSFSAIPAGGLVGEVGVRSALLRIAAAFLQVGVILIYFKLSCVRYSNNPMPHTIETFICTWCYYVYFL